MKNIDLTDGLCHLNLEKFVTETRSIEFITEQYTVFFEKYAYYRNTHILFTCWLDAIEYDRKPKTELILKEYEYYV